MTARKQVSQDESWDAYWASVSRPKVTTIRGVEVAIPTDMPMLVEQRMEELGDSEDLKDIGELVGMVFGRDCLEQWRDAEMGLLEFQVVLTWGMANARGREISFQEAYELTRQGVEEGKAPPPNRAARRAPSAATGGRSKRISSASTSSTTKRSRA
ncbi:hypothetical protein [Streptomyces subrutilus]|uniref:hypothetical protein n=1 Tax=Streptomyces subrutilus TaxID=36818 RepID=UPI002E10FFD9|nr:hypothetical protein OG479_33015 [Streptomyces subrutilus]